jgi:ParB/RepB/Spo0J family partition protein
MWSLMHIALFLCLGLSPGAHERDGPLLWRYEMANKVPNIPNQPTRGVLDNRVDTRVTLVSLQHLPDPAEYEDEFSGRFKDKFTEESLEDIIESLKLDKQLEPVQIVRAKDSRWQIITGHRRVAAMYILARRGVPGFSPDLLVKCLEVLDASHLDLLVRSVADNELGRKLDVKERLKAVEKLDKAGANKKRMAAAFGVSEKAIERDLKIVRNPRVLQHVMDDHLAPTAASAIAEVAGTKGRLEEFLDHFDKTAPSRSGARA